MMSLTPQELLGAKEWNKLIKTNVENALGAKLDGDFIAANYPAGFNYAIKQQFYNEDSLATLNSLVTVTDAVPTLSGSYASLYKNVMGNLEYGFSSDDQKLMNQEETKQAALVGKIIDVYKESGLDDSPEDYPGILYIMQRIKEVTGTDYLRVDIKTYPNLASLCRNLSEYSRIGVNTTKMENAWSQADDKMNAIIKNITSPSEDNGGLKTSGTAFNIGWDKLPETEQLLNSLKQGNTISFSISVDSFSANASSIHFENKVTASVPFNWFFNLKVTNESSYDLSKFAQHDSQLSVSVTYSGLTTLAAIPKPLSDDNGKGWFADYILYEAAVKSGKDSTGYQLHGSEFDPKNLFGNNGKLKRLKTFVLSQQPTITLHFSKFDCTEMQEIFNQKTDIDFSLFGGIISGSHKNSYSFTNYNYNAEKQTLDVSITPTPIGDSGSIGKQTAFVLGGVAETFGS